jgi:subtilisin family serine protease
VRAKSTSAPPAWGVAQIHAPEVWALGYEGAGVVVGSFDTGVDGTHTGPGAALSRERRHQLVRPVRPARSPYDGNGHGTHTTGTMLGGDYSGYQIGVAPGARWIARRAGTTATTRPPRRSTRSSNGSSRPGGDARERARCGEQLLGHGPALVRPEFVDDIAAFRAAGIVPVFSAGNSGPDPGTILAPGSYASAFSVGRHGLSSTTSPSSAARARRRAAAS